MCHGSPETDGGSSESHVRLGVAESKEPRVFCPLTAIQVSGFLCRGLLGHYSWQQLMSEKTLQKGQARGIVGQAEYFQDKIIAEGQGSQQTSSEETMQNR